MFEEACLQRLSRYTEREQVVILSLLNATTLQVVDIVLNNDIFGHGPREVFGNLLGLKETQLRFSFKVRKNRKPRELVRKRGYKDHGTLVRDSHGRKEFDGSYEQQKLIEREERRRREIEYAAWRAQLDEQDDEW
jgi:hypothetical protein